MYDLPLSLLRSGCDPPVSLLEVEPRWCAVVADAGGMAGARR